MDAAARRSLIATTPLRGELLATDTLVEADISRYKRVIGDTMRSRMESRQATEVAIAVRALNRMLEIGRPEYVRIV